MPLQTARTSVEIAGTGANVGGVSPWTNPGNITADDGNDATWGATGGGDLSDNLRASNFGFNIPDNAVIDGVLVVLGDLTQFSAFGLTAQLRTDSETGENKGEVGLQIQPTYGGEDDLWGMTLTPAIVNGSDFGFDLAAGDVSGGDATASVDYIEITVFWHYDVDVPAAEVPQRYDYKVYDAQGQYLGNLPNVVSDFGYSLDINSVGSQLKIDCALTPDTVGVPPLALGHLTQWLVGGWGYRKRITIPRDNIDADMFEFSVYVDLSTLGDDFFENVDTNGDDIRVTDQYGFTELPFDLVDIDTSAKTGELWFRAENLYKDSENVFYIYYGNPTASPYAATDPFGSQNAWAFETAVVYHFEGNANDSSDNSIDGVEQNSPTYVAGKINDGQAVELDGVNQYIAVPDNIQINTAGPYSDKTIAFWFNADDVDTRQVIYQEGGTVNGINIYLDLGTLHGLVYSSSFDNMDCTFLVNADTWYHVVLVMDRDNNITELYVDGVLEDSATSNNTTALPTHTGDIAIGANSDGTVFHDGADDSGVPKQFFNGTVDQFQYYAIVYDAAWAAANYMNQNTPSDFYTVAVRELEVDDDDILIKNGNIVEAYETSFYYPNSRLAFRGQINRVEAEMTPDADSIISMLALSDGRDMDNYVARGSPFAYTTDVSQTVNNTHFTVSAESKGAGWERVGQTWQAGASNLGRIQLRVRGNATVTIKVYADPNLITELGSVTKAVNTGGTFQVVDFIFTNFIETEIGENYFFTVAVNSGQTLLTRHATTNPYANGAMYTASFTGTSGGTYSEVSGRDMYFITASGTPTTQATYNSQDPTTGMMIPIMDDYQLRGGLIDYTDDSIDATGLTLSYTFNTNTVYDATKKVLNMAPNGFYYFVDPGLSRLFFKRTSLSPDFILTKGRHIEALKLVFSIENVINRVLFSGGDTGGGDNLYSSYEDSLSQALYGVRLDRKSDNRVTIQATANAVGNSEVAERKDEQYETTVTVLARTMDISLFKPGKTVGFRGYGTFVDNLMLQVIRVRYRPHMVELVLGTLPIRFDSNSENILRGLIAEQTVNNPSTPS